MKYAMFFFLLVTSFLTRAQDYLGLSKSQLLVVKGSGFKEDFKNNTIIYETPPIFGNEPGTEIYYFDKNEAVIGYLYFKNIYKQELLSLIKYNNSHYQSRNSGVKGELQWIDTVNNVEISLKTSEWTSNISVIFYKVFSMQ